MLPERNRRFLLTLFAIAVVLAAYTLAPFVGAMFAAVVLACALDPWQRRLAKRMGGKPYVAAGLLSIGVVLVVVAPLGVTSAFAVRDGRRILAWTEAEIRTKGLDAFVEPLPDWAEEPAKRAIAMLPGDAVDEAIAESERRHPSDAAATTPATTAETPGKLPDLSGAAGVAGGALSRVVHLLVQTGVFVIALFFLLAEGHRLVDYAVDLAPLDDRRARSMLHSFREVTVGVLLSALVTAVVQTFAASIGYVIASVPALPVVILVTFVCSFIPSIGGSIVTIAAGALVWMSGRAGMGIFLIAWGIVVVSTIDNIVKPWVAKEHTRLPGSVVFFAMICGLAAFGPLGLVAGPLIAALFHTVAKMLRDEREQRVATARKSSEAA